MISFKCFFIVFLNFSVWLYSYVYKFNWNDCFQCNFYIKNQRIFKKNLDFLITKTSENRKQIRNIKEQSFILKYREYFTRTETQLIFYLSDWSRCGCRSWRSAGSGRQSRRWCPLIGPSECPIWKSRLTLIKWLCGQKSVKELATTTMIFYISFSQVEHFNILFNKHRHPCFKYANFT